VASQSELPTFCAALQDRWGNRTGPCEGLQCSLMVECAGLEPARSSVAFDDATGLANVSGQPHTSFRHRLEPRPCLRSFAGSLTPLLLCRSVGLAFWHIQAGAEVQVIG